MQTTLDMSDDLVTGKEKQIKEGRQTDRQTRKKEPEESLKANAQGSSHWRSTQ